VATVAQLVYYPVKGLAGVSVDAAEIGVTGLRHDRAFMLVNPDDGVFLSQRVLPAMAAIRASMDGERLVLSADGYDDAEVEVALDGSRRDVSLFGSWFGSGIDQGDTVAKWCTAVLGRPAALVRVTPEHDRDGWGLNPGKSGFADAHAILMTSLSSLDGLNQRILDRGAEPIPMNRFRPNIVVTGWPEPHTEDRVRRVRIGAVELAFAARAIRCAVPTVDQASGRKAGPEPTRTLASYRREPGYGGGVSFGAKFAVVARGRVAVGDPVEVLERLTPEDELAVREARAARRSRDKIS
jgi:MOSC domain-containing protein